MFYISEYNVSRHYGGPEEGGWWYDIREFVKCWAAYTDEEDGYAVARRLNRESPTERGYVNSGVNPDTEWACESHPAEQDNTREGRPHYE